MFDTARFGARWLIFSLLLALPIVRILSDEQYGWLHLEVGAVLALAVSVAAGLAVCTKRAVVFHTVALALVFVLSVDTARATFWPDARMRWLLPGWLLLVLAAFAIFQRHFYTILTVYLVATSIAGLAEATYKNRVPGRAHAASASTRQHNHVIHIIFDEMLALAAYPDDCQECQTASASLESVLRSGNFEIHSHAFSNFAVTRDSIPSILNGRLANRCYEYVSEDIDEPVLSQNAYFDRYLRNNYDVRVYQSDHILFTGAKYGSLPATTYKLSSVKAWQQTTLPWPARSREILTTYFRSNKIWRNFWDSYMPAGWAISPRRPGPLVYSELWPSGLLNDIKSAEKDTLFFVHLMMPHFPYVFRRNGEIRNPEEWHSSSELHRLRFTQGQETQYREAYAQYSDQVQLVGRQLQTLVDGLRAAGQYDSARLVLHGDHGSRLRFVSPADEAAEKKMGLEKGNPCVVPWAWYSYADSPNKRDLLNRFATLFAIKRAGATQPEVITERTSVMELLWRDLEGSKPAPTQAARSVYLFDAQGRPKAIPLADLW